MSGSRLVAGAGITAAAVLLLVSFSVRLAHLPIRRASVGPEVDRAFVTQYIRDVHLSEQHRAIAGMTAAVTFAVGGVVASVRALRRGHRFTPRSATLGLLVGVLLFGVTFTAIESAPWGWGGRTTPSTPASSP